MTEKMGGLNEEQQWHLQKEGLEARVRNQLSPFLSLLSLSQLYREVEESKKDQVVGFIRNSYGSAIDCFNHLKALSIEVNNLNLTSEVEKLAPIIEQINHFIESKDIESIDLIINNQGLYNKTIEDIINLSKN